MELDWSKQSPHIRTLYRSWQPGDGYEEAMIMTVEARLGVRLPDILRAFYLAWGRRRDLVGMQDILLPLHELDIRADALIFCVENQALVLWAVRCRDLEGSNPPVVVAYREDIMESNSPVVTADVAREHPSMLPWRPSHTHLSDFLDDLTYRHAFCGGAIHGGFSGHFRPQKYQYTWLELHWHRAIVTPLCFGLFLDDDAVDYDLRLYVCEGQALACSFGFSIAARKAQALDEIGQELQVTWVERW